MISFIMVKVVKVCAPQARFFWDRPFILLYIRGGGRGRKSNATKQAEKAQLAAFLARKYGTSSRMAREAGACGAAEGMPLAEEVECLGERTREERDAEGRSNAVDLDAAAPADAASCSRLTARLRCRL